MVVIVLTYMVIPCLVILQVSDDRDLHVGSYHPTVLPTLCSGLLNAIRGSFSKVSDERC